MDTKLLEDALILLEQNNLTAAAERRNMTQPAFSRRIQALEHWVGQELLTRGANRIDVSPKLAEAAPQIRALLAQLDQLQQQLKNPEPATRLLILAAPHALSASAVAEVLNAADTSGARWHIRLVTRNQDEAISLFLTGEADLLLSYENKTLPQIPFDDTVSRHPWRLDAFVPVVGGPLRHRLEDGNRLPEDAPTIGYPAGSMFGKVIREHETRMQSRLPDHVMIESTFSVGIANLVRAGVGAAWVPECLIRPDILNGDVIVLSEDYGRIPMEIALYNHASNDRVMTFLPSLLHPR